MGKRKTYFAEIAVGDLAVDETLAVQRPLQRAWVNRLARMWNPGVLTTAIVSLRTDGKYYLLDGRHSCEAAKLVHGPGFLRLCQVHEGLTLKEESNIFLAANRDRKPVTRIDTYRVEITSGDPIVRRIEDEVTALGLEVAKSPSPNRVAAIDKLKHIAAMGPGMVTRTLRITENAWGRQKDTWDGMTIYALALVLKRNPSADDARLVTILRRRPVQLWKQSALGQSRGGGGSQSRSKPLAVAITDEYNARLSTTRKIDFP